MRVCILNHETTRADVESVLEYLATAAPSHDHAQADALVAAEPQTARVTTGWPLPPSGLPSELRAMPLLEGVGEEVVDWVAVVGRSQPVPAGEAVVGQWGMGRDFYLLLEGEAAVTVDGASIVTMTGGEYFGELAAFDWGAGFAYPRTATVTAVTDLRLVVLRDVELAELMNRSQLVDARVRQQAALRLRRA